LRRAVAGAQSRHRRAGAAARPAPQATPVKRTVTALAAVCCGLAGGAAPALAQAAVAVTAAPAISAPAAILIQPSTGDIVFQRRATQHRAIASTTKLMTALLTLERRRLSDKITVAPYAAAPAESVAGLRAGEQLTTADLLRALLLASANDAAAT